MNIQFAKEILFRLGVAVVLTFVAALPGQAAAEDGAVIVKSRCYDCHSSDLSEGEFSIEPLLKQERNAASHAQTLEKIRKRVAAGEMPPQDAVPLKDAERTQLLNWLDGSLAQLAEKLRDAPGLVVMPRLTNGVNPDHWWARRNGERLELSKTLQPLADFEKQLLVLRELHVFNNTSGPHWPLFTNYLNGAPVRQGLIPNGAESIDQLIARHVGRQTAVPGLVLGVVPPRPVINGELSYERLDKRDFGGDVISADVTRRMFWVSIVNGGAAGATYGANGIWQVNRRGEPYGPSPHGNSWGDISWDEAIKLPGSTQVGLAKRLLMQFEWHRFRPSPERVAWIDPKTKREGGLEADAYAMEIPGSVLIVYAADAETIQIEQLDPDRTYAATYFNPVSGKMREAAEVTFDEHGAWTCDSPEYDHDWVLILRTK